MFLGEQEQENNEIYYSVITDCCGRRTRSSMDFSLRVFTGWSFFNVKHGSKLIKTKHGFSVLWAVSRMLDGTRNISKSAYEFLLQFYTVSKVLMGAFFDEIK